MKKILAFCLSALIMLGACAGALAQAEGSLFDFGESGFKLTLDQPIQGLLMTSGYHELSTDTGVCFTDLYYYGMTATQLTNANMGNVTQEELTYLQRSIGWLCGIVAINGGRGADDVLALFSQSFGPDDIVKVGEAGDYTFFRLGTPESDFPEDIDPVYSGEFETLSATLDDILTAGAYREPLGPFGALSGAVFSFTTTDIDGNPVDSAELFAEHEITMVNVWTTWCGYCLDEMGELSQIHERVADVDCAVVGMLYDTDKKDEARRLMDQLGVTYPVILAPAGVNDLLNVTGYPTSFFVDREGRFVGRPIVGARVSEYEPAIRSLAQAASSGDGAAAAAVPNDLSAYRVLAVDEAGAPVAGVAVQLCTDALCMMAVTDADGVALFEAEPVECTVKVIAVPEGYQADEAEYPMPEAYSDLTIVLKAG